MTRLYGKGEGNGYAPQLCYTINRLPNPEAVRKKAGNLMQNRSSPPNGLIFLSGCHSDTPIFPQILSFCMFMADRLLVFPALVRV